MTKMPTCVCGHSAWAHGAQSGYPSPEDGCHAAVGELLHRECGCGGYRPDGAADGPMPLPEWERASPACICGHAQDKHDLSDGGPEECDACGCEDWQPGPPLDAPLGVPVAEADELVAMDHGPDERDAEIARLREALRKIAREDGLAHTCSPLSCGRCIARATLDRPGETPDA